ncbi:MAG: hypothetical protein KDK76_03665 [Chlamydiia bacterium]|nr:hypothetical protein [Chlamydiia bacterium]
MTFFPDPIRPSEGRQEDEIRVNPIEADKHGRENQTWGAEPEKGQPRIYGAFLIFIQKLVTLFNKEKEGGELEALSEDSLSARVQDLKQTLQILMESDQSASGKFCAQFSAVWHKLLQGVQALSHTRKSPLVDVDKLKTLLADINHYPPNEDHKLGYYLSEFAGETWLPVPFREILKKLFSDHRINQSHSTLSQWVELISEILQS